jgi:hypothetical protein
MFTVTALAAAALGAALEGAANAPGEPGHISLPFSALALGCIVLLVAAWAWFNSELVRPLNTLGQIARAFSRGEETPRTGWQTSDRAPLPPWQAVDTLAGVLDAQTHTLEDALNVERVLLREVNHRIRNNLQMVSSILAIQARADETQGASRAHDRVELLALAHDRIYASGVVHDVRLDDLAAEIGRNMMSVRGARARSVRLNLAVEPARTTNDCAVPMAFLIGESLSHALAVLGPEAVTTMTMALYTEPDGAIVFSLSSPAFSSHRLLLPSVRRVMDAFASQLSAVITHAAEGPELIRVRLPAPITEDACSAEIPAML